MKKTIIGLLALAACTLANAGVIHFDGAMDEFTVPEPGSLALMGTSLAGLIAARRRKRTA